MCSVFQWRTQENILGGGEGVYTFFGKISLSLDCCNMYVTFIAHFSGNGEDVIAVIGLCRYVLYIITI